MSKVSIIIPVYRTEKYLRDCLNSCLAQSFTDFEIVVVNDGSPDNSQEILDEYQALDSRITVIKQSNKGLVETRRVGACACKSEYLFFLDSDDTIVENALEQLLAYSCGKDIVIGGMNIYTPKGKRIKTIKNTLPFGNDVIGLIAAYLSKNVVASLCGRLIKKSVFCKIEIERHFKIGEDFIANLLLASNSISCQIVDCVVYNYIQYDTSMVHNISEESLKNRLAFIDWVLDFVDNWKNQIVVKNSIAQFAIEEYYTYLRGGGRLNDSLKCKIRNEFMKNEWAIKRLPLWRVGLVKCYCVSPYLGNIYRYFFVNLNSATL